eukprot:gene6547-8697_t
MSIQWFPGHMHLTRKAITERAKEIDVVSGGGAVKLKVNGAGKFLALTLDPEFLKEDAKVVADTVLAA